MKRASFLIGSAALAFVLLGAGCGSQPVAKVPVTPPAPTVSVRPVNASRSITRDLTFPGLVAAEVETTLVAKAAGTVRGLNTATGKRVALGEEVAQVNDSDAAAVKTNALVTSQVKQAQLAVSQALTAYELAQSSYRTAVESSAKELSALDVARRQASTGLSDLGTTSDNQRASATIARDAAATALEQARLALDDRKTQAKKSEDDAKTNARMAADNAVDAASSALVALDGVAALSGTDGLLPYGQYLGLRKQQSYDDAKQAWATADKAVKAYRASAESDAVKRLALAEDVAAKTKATADATKTVFDFTPPSSALPAVSAVGASISAFQQQVAGVQTQMNGLVTQLTNAHQGLDTLALGNSSSIEALQKTVDLAAKQLEAAEQNLKSLEAGTKTQTDQAAFGKESAERQYDAAKTRSDGQLAAAKSQVDLARLQYENAVAGLEALVDSRRVYSSLEGTVTQVFVENGETVGAGSPIMTIATTNRLLIDTYVDGATAADLRPGLPAKISGSDGSSASGTILTVSPVADPATKRFKVEVAPTKDSKFLIGLIVDVTIPVTHEVSAPDVLLPLAALTVTNDGSYLFVVRDGKAKKLNAVSGAIYGETAQVSSADLSDNDILVINGAKIVSDGVVVNIGE